LGDAGAVEQSQAAQQLASFIAKFSPEIAALGRVDSGGDEKAVSNRNPAGL
jgi:hypothetical protein